MDLSRKEVSNYATTLQAQNGQPNSFREKRRIRDVNSVKPPRFPTKERSSRRASTLSEVATAVVFLASDDAANITGATLSVDGGWSAV
jgi:NAD(P)-dependent dehydrogenase (short-subunit alcohol dehydrogenase family)